MPDCFGLEDAYGNKSSLMSRKMALVSDICEPADSLLDIGCGTGEFISRIESKFGKIVGIDSDSYLLEQCKRRFSGNGKVKIMRADVSEISELGKFGAVSALDVVEHVDDPRALLAAIYSVLKPGGRFYMTTPNWFDKIFIRVRKSPHKTAHSSFGWKKLVTDAGFKVESIRTVKFPLINSDFLNRRLHPFGMCVLIVARK